MRTATRRRTFRFADRAGEEYRVTYHRNKWGRHAWTVRTKSDGGGTYTDFRQKVNRRELTPAEIFTGARDWAGSTAANRDQSLLEPAGVDEEGRPLYTVFLAHLET